MGSSRDSKWSEDRPALCHLDSNHGAFSSTRADAGRKRFVIPSVKIFALVVQNEVALLISLMNDI